MQETILLLAFGQSNADVHIAGPRGASQLFDDPGILVPDDGWGIRGLMGRGEQPHFTDFVPACSFEPNNQSLLHAAAARIRHEHPQSKVIIRSAAKGGRRLYAIKTDEREIEGIYKNADGGSSIHFRNLIKSLEFSIEANAQSGGAIKSVYILWLHGESDRAMEAGEYGEVFRQLIDEVAAACDYPDISIQWLTIQAGGTSYGGDGNHWENRLALLDDDLQDIAPCVAAGHICGYFDQSHYSARGKLALGEWLGHVVSGYETGNRYRLPVPKQARKIGPDYLELKFDVDITIDGTEPIGFQVKNGPHLLNIRSVEIGKDRTIRIRLENPNNIRQLHINYAYARNQGFKDFERTPDRPYGYGNLRTTYEIPSVLSPGSVLYEPIPGFSIATLLNEVEV